MQGMVESLGVPQGGPACSVTWTCEVDVGKEILTSKCFLLKKSNFVGIPWPAFRSAVFYLEISQPVAYSFEGMVCYFCI